MDENILDTVVRIDKTQLSLYELKRRCEVTKRIIFISKK